MFSSIRRHALACAVTLAGLWATAGAASADPPAVLPLASHPAPAVGCAGGNCDVPNCHGAKCGRCAECKAIKRDIWACCKAPAVILPPLGTYTRNAFELQRQNALAEYFTVYGEDFLLGTATLNDTGLRHLDGIVRRMNDVGAPIKIEPSGSALDDKRKQAVINTLLKAGVDPSVVTRVVIGRTRAEGLRYDEVDRIGQRVIVGPSTQGGGGYGGFGGFR